MTEQEINKAKEDINKLSQRDMAFLWRFAPLNHPYFDKRNGDLSEYFKTKFKEKGWFTPTISKSIGWDKPI